MQEGPRAVRFLVPNATVQTLFAARFLQDIPQGYTLVQQNSPLDTIIDARIKSKKVLIIFQKSVTGPGSLEQ